MPIRSSHARARTACCRSAAKKTKLSSGDGASVWSASHPLVLQRLFQPGGIITAIAEQPFDHRQAAEQRPCADVIAHLSGGYKQIERSSLAVANGVQLGVHAAFGPTDQAATPPFLTAILVAVRCAFRYVASIITASSSPCSAARPAIIRAKCPFRSNASNASCGAHRRWVHHASAGHFG